MLSFRSILLTVFAASFAVTTNAGTVCRLDYLDGYKPAKTRALSVIQNHKTSNPMRLEVYVEMTEEGPYFHSNFLSEDADHVTKIGGFPELNSLELAIQNMIFSSNTDNQFEVYQTMQKAMSSVKVYLDRSVFNSDGTVKIDLDDAKNLYVLTQNTPVEVEQRRLGWRDIFISKVVGCCFYGIPPHDAAKLKGFLQGKKILSNKIKFASMINDTATDDAIANSTLVLKAHEKGSFFGFFKPKFQSSSDLSKMIRKNRNGTLVLLGHHEGGQFVRRAPDGTKEFSVDLKEMHQLAKKNNVLLIALGCSTADELVASKSAISTLSNINTVEMVEKLEKALSTSVNYAEFFENISDADNMMVASIDVIEGWPKITVYDDVNFELDQKELGAFFILGLDQSEISVVNEDRCVDKKESRFKIKNCPNTYESFVSNKVSDRNVTEGLMTPWD